jgi:predicted unusual protein kinase regulating ubiquinone biosynthesis (AarF/ABC1/UbiB family)
MPPLPGNVARQIVEAELRAASAGSLREVFKSLDLDSALGCASIAQVHYGVLRKGNRPVAVKVQQPDAKLLMASDLGNFRLLAEILQRTELKFDLVGPLNELSQRLNSEFDFEREARSMNMVRDMLRNRVRGVRVPLAIEPLVTQRLLVMEFLEGSPLSKLNGKIRSKRVLRRFGKRIIKKMGEAYGEMILMHGFFQADPHPGNILILNRKADIGIIDFGQTMAMSNHDRYAFAELVDAMARRHPSSVATAMSSLGIVVEDIADAGERKRVRQLARSRQRRIDTPVAAPAMVPAFSLATEQREQRVTALQSPPCDRSESASAGVATNKLTATEQLAYTMFDTAEVSGVSSNPFSEKSALRTATVKALPQDLFFLLRTLQIMRGICSATGNSDVSIASQWAPMARRALRSRRE